MNNQQKHEQSDHAKSTTPSEWRANSEKNLQLDSIGDQRFNSSSSILGGERLPSCGNAGEKRTSLSQPTRAVTGGILKQLITETEDQLQFIQMQQEKLESRLKELNLLFDQLSQETDEIFEKLEPNEEE